MHWKCELPKTVSISFNAFPKLERIFSTEKSRATAADAPAGLLWRQMKHDINRLEGSKQMFTKKFLHIFFRGLNMVGIKTSTFWLLQVCASFSIFHIFRSLSFDSVTKWLEHRKLIMKTAAIYEPPLKSSIFHRGLVAQSIIWHFSKGLEHSQLHDLSIGSYWLHCSLFVRGRGAEINFIDLGTEFN